VRLVTGLDTQVMRIPHYLVLSVSGVYHFRLKVPADAQAALGVRVLKQSLRTRDTRTAQIHSSLLYLRYASAIAAARGGDVMPKPPSVEDLLASFQQGGIRPFELELDPATRFPTRIQTDGSPQDNAAALEAMKVVFATPLPVRAAPSPKPPSMSLGEALRTYELTEGPSLTDNTGAGPHRRRCGRHGVAGPTRIVLRQGSAPSLTRCECQCAKFSYRAVGDFLHDACCKGDICS